MVIDDFISQAKRKGLLSDLIQYDNLEARKQTIKKWSDARMMAIDAYYPSWVDYIRVCDELSSDAQVVSITNTVKNKVKGKPFVIKDKDGNINEQKTDFVNTEWFLKIIDYVIESAFYPYTLIEFGNLNNNNIEVNVIKREYVIPQKNIVTPQLYGTTGHDYTSAQLAPFYAISLAENQLGLLDAITPSVLGKKYMSQYWLRYAEIFGIPWRIGKTDIRDNVRRDNMQTMLNTAGSSMSVTLDKEDDVEFLTTSGADAYQLFKEFIIQANNDISKTLAGAVGILDEKSFVGSAEAGERLFDDQIRYYCVKVTNFINKEVIPRFITTYKLPFSFDDYFTFINKETVSFENKLKAVEVLSSHYKLDSEQIEEDFGYKVTPIASYVPDKVDTNDAPTKAKEAASSYIKLNANTPYFNTIASKISEGVRLSFEEISTIAAQKQFENSKDEESKMRWQACGGGSGVNWAIRKVQQINGKPDTVIAEVHNIYKDLL